MSLSVLLAEDHPVVREGLRAMLEAEGDFQVVGQTGNSSEVGAWSRNSIPTCSCST